MMRTRTQNGEVYQKGQKWYLRYFDWRVEDGQLIRKRLCKPLGSKDDMTKTQARGIAKDFLETINAAKLEPETAVTFVDFVEHVYLPRLKQDVRPSTYRGYITVWNTLKPFCTDLWTRDIRTKHIQCVLDEIARTDRFNKRTLQHIKFFLSGAFGLAIRNDYYIGGNPVAEAKIPAKVRGAGKTHAHSLEEILVMMDATPEPGRTLIAVAAFTALRRGELWGLRWEDYRNGEIHVSRSIWNGHETDPKTEESKNAVPVISKLAAILAEHRKGQNNPISGWIFPNGAGNAADPNAVLQRIILPALSVCGVCSKTKEEHATAADHEYQRNAVLPEWHGWHAFRRGVATNLNRLGVPDKIIQRVLRHSNVAVTQASYIKPEDKDSKAAMEKFETALTATQLPPKTKVLPIKSVM
jgi:integrase